MWKNCYVCPSLEQLKRFLVDDKGPIILSINTIVADDLATQGTKASAV